MDDNRKNNGSIGKVVSSSTKINTTAAADSPLPQPLASKIEELSLAYEKHQKQYKSNPKVLVASQSNSGELLKQNQVNVKNTSMVGSTASQIADRTAVTSSAHSGININQLQTPESSLSTANIRRFASTESKEFRLGAAGRDREVTTSYTESLDELLQAAKNQVEYRHANNQRMSVVSEEPPGSPVVPNLRNATVAATTPRIEVNTFYGEEEGAGGDQIVASNSSQQQDFYLNQYGSLSFNNSAINSSFNEQQQQQDAFGFIQYTSIELAQNKPKRKEAKVVGSYVLGDVLGEGQYGKVKEGFCIQTLKRVAVKIMRLSKIRKIPGGEGNIRQEISILKRLKHKNIVELINVIFDTEKEKFYEVFEYCAGTLSQLQSHAVDGKLPLGQSQRYFKHLIRGLQYLQSKSVIHHDIKPANLILSVDDCLKIADFGLAEELSTYVNSEMVVTGTGTPAFQPPETAAALPHCSGFKIDIWASGITLYNMISGHYPFDGSNNYTLFEAIVRCEYSIPLEADSQLADLLYGILEKDPSRRLTVEMISAHPWLKIEYPRHPDEVPVTSILYEHDVYENVDELRNEDVPPHRPASPAVLAVPGGTANVDEDWAIREEKARIRRQQRGHLSNPRFAHDTSLVPYLELMYDDLPTLLRRSSVVDKYVRDRMQQRHKAPQHKRPAISDKFLRRFSRSFHHDEQQPQPQAQPQVPSGLNSPSPKRLSRFSLSPRMSRSKSNNNSPTATTTGGSGGGGCGMQ